MTYDRDKLIIAHKICSDKDTDCKGCPYEEKTQCTDELHVDTLEYIKNSMPMLYSVNELKELDHWHGWIEFQEERSLPGDKVIREAYATEGMLFVKTDNKNEVFRNLDFHFCDFGVTWRVWKMKPTEILAEAVEWNE